jgi:hypothetical protein
MSLHGDERRPLLQAAARDSLSSGSLPRQSSHVPSNLPRSPSPRSARAYPPPWSEGRRSVDNNNNNNSNNNGKQRARSPHRASRANSYGATITTNNDDSDYFDVDDSDVDDDDDGVVDGDGGSFVGHAEEFDSEHARLHEWVGAVLLRYRWLGARIRTLYNVLIINAFCVALWLLYTKATDDEIWLRWSSHVAPMGSWPIEVGVKITLARFCQSSLITHAVKHSLFYSLFLPSFSSFFTFPVRQCLSRRLVTE